MAKYRKYRKSPKQSASLETWARYREHIKDVDKYNAQIDKDKASKKKAIADVKKMKSKR